MTYPEVFKNTHYYEYTANQGDNLVKIAAILYDSTSAEVIKMLIALNLRYDWDYLPAGTIIRYLPLDVVKKVNEV